MVANHHALSHPAGGQAAWHHQAGLLAHLPAHLRNSPQSQRRGHQSGAGAVTSWFDTRDTGHLRAGADARKTGGTAEGRRDGTGQTPSIGGLKGRLNAPQNAPRLKQGKIAKLLILCAVKALVHSGD